ncbi:MAG TPA: hypothetical protein VEA60_03565 [Allosphingosinicella sp.]|nr:hypothetical protein [Allosphingosinicella sp.]
MTSQPIPAPRPEAGSALDHSTQLMTSFAPVPRRYRHDGWTPERQRAFILALAETGCVERAARRVNIAQTNCYELRRAPGAESFRRAWDAALDFAVPKLKDVAFQRAIEGELVPVFSGGKLMGFRRKYNDKLLMFCLRHYGQDASGRRTTINYFSTRASAGSADGAAGAEAATTTVRTVITGPGAGSGQAANDDERGARGDEAAAILGAFEGVVLDTEAAAAIAAALEACAARARAADAAYDKGGDAAVEAAADDPGEPFVRADLHQAVQIGALEPAVGIEEWMPFVEGEPPWELAGLEMPPERAALKAREEAKAAASGRKRTGDAVGLGGGGRKPRAKAGGARRPAAPARGGGSGA